MGGERYHLLRPNDVFSTIYVQLKSLPRRGSKGQMMPGIFHFVSYGNTEIIPFQLHGRRRCLVAAMGPGLEIYPSYSDGSCDGVDFIVNRRERVRFRRDDGEEYLDPTEEIAILGISPIV